MEDQLAQLKQEFKLLWGNRRDFIIMVLVLLLAVLAAYFLTYQEYDKISGNQDKLSDMQDNIDSLEQRKLAWQKALSNPDYQEKAALVDKVLPSYKPVLETIYLFSDLLESHAVAMNKFDFAPGEIATSGAQTAEQKRRRTSNSRNYLVINFNVSGQYDEVLRFLRDSERTAPLGTVAEAQISKNDSDWGTARVIYYAYYFDQETGQTASTNLPSITEKDSEFLADLVNYYILDEVETNRSLDPNVVKNDLFSEAKSSTTEYIESSGESLSLGESLSGHNEEVSSQVEEVVQEEVDVGEMIE